MCAGNHSEAWKGVIEFSKVILTFSSTVTVVLIGYYIANDVRPRTVNVLPLVFILIAAIFSLFGFGRAIVCLKKGDSQSRGLLFCNLGAIALFIGIVLAFYLQPIKDKSFSAAFNETLKEMQTSMGFTKSDVKECSFQNGVLTVVFVKDGKATTVKYELNSSLVTSMRTP